MAITELDARQLVEAHQAGDERAFSEIARLAYPALHNHALRRLGDHHAAEDAVQETFVRAFRALPRFEGEFRLQAWLHRICANVCADEGNRRTKERLLLAQVDGEELSTSPGPHDSVPEVDRVRRALDALSPSYREALALRVFSDLPFADVADRIGTSEENARIRYGRARRALRRVLQAPGAAVIWLIAPVRRITRVLPVPAPGAEGTALNGAQVAQTGPIASPLLSAPNLLSNPVVFELAQVAAQPERVSVAMKTIGLVAAAALPVIAPAAVGQLQPDRLAPDASAAVVETESSTALDTTPTTTAIVIEHADTAAASAGPSIVDALPVAMAPIVSAVLDDAAIESDGPDVGPSDDPDDPTAAPEAGGLPAPEPKDKKDESDSSGDDDGRADAADPSESSMVVGEDMQAGTDDEERTTLDGRARMWVDERVVVGDLTCVWRDADFSSIRCTFTPAEETEGAIIQISMRRQADGAFQGRWEAVGGSSDGGASADLVSGDEGLEMTIELAPNR